DPHVLVLGGAGGMGRWLVEYVLGFETRATLSIADVADDVGDVAVELARDLDRSIGSHVITYEGDSCTGLPDLSDVDVLVVAVPAREVSRACCVVRSLSHRALVFDV